MRSFLCTRRAQQCRIRQAVCCPTTVTRASRSKARLRAVTIRRRLMAKPCTPHLITRKGYATSVRQQSCQRLCNPQAAQLFEPQTANVRGRGGRPLVLSLGGCKGGYSLSRKRVSPFYALPHGAGIVLLHRCRKKLFYASGVKIPFSVTSIVQRISCSSTGTSGDMSCSRQMSTVGQWSCGSRRS